MRRHLNFSNVISMVALFFAPCGGSYAAISTQEESPPAITQEESALTTEDSAQPEQTVDDAQGDDLSSADAVPAEPEDASSTPAPGDDPTGSQQITELTETGDDAELQSPPEQSEHPHQAQVHPERGQGPDADQSSEEHDQGADEGRDGAAHRDGEAHGGGPPAWAPAYGYRCKQAGAAPGSAEFRDCIESSK